MKCFPFTCLPQHAATLYSKITTVAALHKIEVAGFSKPVIKMLRVDLGHLPCLECFFSIFPKPQNQSLLVSRLEKEQTFQMPSDTLAMLKMTPLWLPWLCWPVFGVKIDVLEKPAGPKSGRLVGAGILVFHLMEIG